MRVLVTGGAGFIGSHIVDDLLAAGHEPAVVDDMSSGTPHNVAEGVPIHQVDIRDRDALLAVFRDFSPEAVCHQAAQMSVSRSVREPAFDAEVNIAGLINTLDGAVACGAKRIVFASSGGVLYGDVFEPVDENHPADPISPYGISKWVGERYLKFYAAEHGMQCVALRYSNVYGPRQNPHGEAGVVAIFSESLLKGDPATINGDGKYVRDYVYVADVSRANIDSLEKELDAPFTAFNIGTAVATDVNQLEEKIRECAAKHNPAAAAVEPLHREPRAGDLRSSLITAKLAQSQLEWSPKVQVADGLEETVDWFAGRK